MRGMALLFASMGIYAFLSAVGITSLGNSNHLPPSAGPSCELCWRPESTGSAPPAPHVERTRQGPLQLHAVHLFDGHIVPTHTHLQAGLWGAVDQPQAELGEGLLLHVLRADALNGLGPGVGHPQGADHREGVGDA